MKANFYVGTKAVNMRHQVQTRFRGTFVVIPQHQKGYLVYVPQKRKIVSSHDVIIDESFYSALEKMLQPYIEAMAMQPEVLYIQYSTSSKEQSGDIITFTNFEERNLKLEYHNGTESGDESGDDSTLAPLISETKMDKMSSGDEYDEEPMSTDML